MRVTHTFYRGLRAVDDVLSLCALPAAFGPCIKFFTLMNAPLHLNCCIPTKRLRSHLINSYSNPSTRFAYLTGEGFFSSIQFFIRDTHISRIKNTSVVSSYYFHSNNCISNLLQFVYKDSIYFYFYVPEVYLYLEWIARWLYLHKSYTYVITVIKLFYYLLYYKKILLVIYNFIGWNIVSVHSVCLIYNIFFLIGFLMTSFHYISFITWNACNL